MPLPMNSRTDSGGTGSKPNSLSIAAADAAISGAVSRSVPSRSSKTARMTAGFLRITRQSGPCEVPAHLRDGLGVVPRSEDRRSCNECIGAGCCDFRNVVGLDSAVDLNPDLPPVFPHGCVYPAPDFPNLGK